MNYEKNKKKSILFFILAVIVIIALFAAAFIRTDAFNSKDRQFCYEGDVLFGNADCGEADITCVLSARPDTWTKVFDFNGEGLTDPNYQAYIYDLGISNDSQAVLDSYKVTLKPGTEMFLSSAWNGSVEIHQMTAEGEKTALIPDLRSYDPAEYDLDIVTVDGESLIRLVSGDSFVYEPSTAANAIEVPVGPGEGTTPGFIFYLGIGDDFSATTADMEYTLYKSIVSDILFKLGLAAIALTLLAGIIAFVTGIQVRQYRLRHERDNEIIQESIETFTGFIDAKDPYTNGHSRRVAMYTKLLAKEMGYDDEELERIYYVALLHDCGKMGVPDSILTKPGKLTGEEFEVIKSHTLKGREILSNFSSIEGVAEGATYHHERYDGMGYPEGRKGTEIPKIARIICVADSFDAMNSDRCYRKKLTREQIVSELEKNKGRQFDPEIAGIMLRLINERKVVV